MTVHSILQSLPRYYFKGLNYHIQIAKFQNAVSGDDIYTLDIWGTFFITNLVFWSIGSIYCYFDVTTTPKFLRKYKIQPETNEPVDPKKFKNLIWTVFLNQTVVYIPLRLLKVIRIKSMKPQSIFKGNCRRRKCCLHFYESKLLHGLVGKSKNTAD